MTGLEIVLTVAILLVIAACSWGLRIFIIKKIRDAHSNDPAQRLMKDSKRFLK